MMSSQQMMSVDNLILNAMKKMPTIKKMILPKLGGVYFVDLREKPDGAPCPDDDITKKVHLNVLVYHNKMNPIEYCDSITAFEDFLEWHYLKRRGYNSATTMSLMATQLEISKHLLNEGAVIHVHQVEFTYWMARICSRGDPPIHDLFHVFSSVPRDLNFIDHTSDLGWKEFQRVQPIIVDPGLYLARRTKIFQATEKRPTPEAFKFFTGSPWVMLSRSFMEFCVLGWDNLPRTLLMYFSNVVLAEEGYFHSVICNAPNFQNNTINSDLRYMVWGTPPGMEPHFLNSTNFDDMVQSGAAFARQFRKNDPILDMVDEKILRRRASRAAPGAWCSGRRSWWADPCSQWADVNSVKPGPHALKFGESVAKMLEEWKSESGWCK
ncbi:beta-glucuronosyltransferase GlcAT14A [Cinnamomum micranthum f. kanehirae]|uniref:Beta-glucuronosyltransferase GlcAT14A n=1 Tax=Cinnamomum micranthum f. kanehirae TaxID=337451 RepID=A0A3S3N981_9MAGN|nr:beta-glucuronosyltransferase GlcAT14A [Cinnamomum micranthum f. kanehirae]